jgi:hypothetical protein
MKAMQVMHSLTRVDFFILKYFLPIYVELLIDSHSYNLYRKDILEGERRGGDEMQPFSIKFIHRFFQIYLKKYVDNFLPRKKYFRFAKLNGINLKVCISMISISLFMYLHISFPR